MSKKANSFLVFEKYWVDHVNYKHNERFNNQGQEIELNIKFKVSHHFMNEKQDKVHVHIYCELFSDIFSETSNPFHLNLNVVGEFSVSHEAGLPEELVLNTMRSNTVAILFPYVRSTITTITATANIPPVIIHPINTNKLLEIEE